MRGNPIILIEEYAKQFCLRRAMDKAGYRGQNRIYEAVRDIEEHADILRREISGGDSKACRDERRERILREYERIAFAGDDEGIRTADKLKALEQYRLLSDAGPAEAPVVVSYDYGDEDG